jgi:hypothetical protein
MQILSLNGELERARVDEWVATLKKEDSQPLKNEESLDIGEMEPEDRDLVISLLRNYREIVEKRRDARRWRRRTCSTTSTRGTLRQSCCAAGDMQSWRTR